MVKVKVQLLDGCFMLVPDVPDAVIGQQMFCLLWLAQILCLLPHKANCREVCLDGFKFPLPVFRSSCFHVEELCAAKHTQESEWPV